MICVTGGTGFIGSNLVRALLERGERVRLLVRPGGRPAGSPGASWLLRQIAGRGSGARTELELAEAANRIEIVWGDVTDRDAVNRLAQGARVIYHLAAVARAWSRDPAEFHRVNAGGTANVLQAARAWGVSRVVHVSTELVDGDATPYQRSKREAEALVQRYVSEGGDAVIVRPTRVYGPGPLNQANSVTRLIELYRRGWFRVRLADGGARGNYVYVEDLVCGMIQAGDKGGNGGVYVLGGENATVEELCAAVAAAAGKRHGVLELPVPVAKTIAGLMELLGHLGLEPAVTRAWIRVLLADRPMSWEKAARELGYNPRPLLAGVEATVRWLEKTRGQRR
ncbi:3 beta-hydroxysteroid dehydrogenase/Delta 5--_4-isomerase [bacterium HR33]|nr:3 beta-hydroxysteroid dehydrogenase/Delta 5-->4-isomerase [bacterium HR33]